MHSTFNLNQRSFPAMLTLYITFISNITKNNCFYFTIIKNMYFFLLIMTFNIINTVNIITKYV